MTNYRNKDKKPNRMLDDILKRTKVNFPKRELLWCNQSHLKARKENVIQKDQISIILVQLKDTDFEFGTQERLH